MTKIYKDFLKATLDNDNNSLKRQCFENTAFALQDNGYQHIIDEVYIEKSTEDLEKGYIIANGEGYFVAYYKLNNKYYYYNNSTGISEVTTKEKIIRHIKQDAYEIQRYFNILLSKSDIGI